MLIKSSQVIFEQRGTRECALTIRTSLCIHLQQAKIDAKLNFFLTVFTYEFSHHHLAGMVFPFVQDVRNIKIHFGNMNRQNSEVNASSFGEQDYEKYE